MPVSNFSLQYWIASGIINITIFLVLMTGVVNYLGWMDFMDD